MSNLQAHGDRLTESSIITNAQQAEKKEKQLRKFQNISTQDQENRRWGEQYINNGKSKTGLSKKVILLTGIVLVVIALLILVVLNLNSKIEVFNDLIIKSQQQKQTQGTNVNSKIIGSNDLIIKSQKEKQMQIKKLNSKIEALNELIVKSQKLKQTQLTNLKIKITDLNELIVKSQKQKQTQRKNLNSEISSLNDQLAKFQKGLQDFNSNLNSSAQKNKKSQKEGQTQVLNSKITDLNSKLVQSQKEVQKLNKTQSQMNDKLAQSQREVQRLNNAQKSVDVQLSQSKKEVQKLKASQKFQSIQHRLSPLKFNYPTVGVPIPGNLFNSTKVQVKDLPEFDKVVNELFQPYNDTDCEYGRFGKPNQGGYVVCKNFLSQSQALINVGVNGANYDDFGCDLTSAFKIPNYLYDCTNPIEPKCPTNNDGNLFLQVCVGDQKEKANGFLFYTLKDMIRDRRLTKKHITIKIDTEGGEYSAWKYFPMEDLDYVDQIVTELHFGGIGPNVWGIYPEAWGHLDIFRSLTEKFVIVNYHCMNGVRFLPQDSGKRGLKSRAYQLTLVNRKLIKLKSNSRSYVENSFSHISIPGAPNCQAGP